MTILSDICQAIKKGDIQAVSDLAEKALIEGISVQEVLAGGLIGGMDLVSASWKQGEMFIPEVLRSAKAMQSGLARIKPALDNAECKSRGRVVLGTVQGDLHDIGKNIVGMMLAGNGFEVFDLGVNVSAEQFLVAAQEKQADIVGISALLTTTLPAMQETVAALHKGLGDGVKTMVGGAPVSKEFAEKIQATGYAPDAVGAVELAKKFCQ